MASSVAPARAISVVLVSNPAGAAQQWLG